MFHRSSRRTALLAALAALSTGVLAQAPASSVDTSLHGWPSKPLRLIVGFPAGSSPDLTARTLAEPLGRALGQPVIVENKVGAGGNIGADAVAKATDNHTIGLMINGNMTIAKLLNPRIPYDPVKDLAPVSLIGTSPLVLTAPANAPGANAAEFFMAALKAGDSWSYGSPGVGTVGHIGMELLKAQTHISPVHIPYPGYPQVANAMIAGELHLSMLPPALALAQVKAGKLRAIGVTSSSRSPLAPDLPSLTEGGLPNFNLEIWNAIAAPRSMPQAMVNKLSATFSDIVRSPDIRTKLLQQGWYVRGTSAEGLAQRIESDTQLLGGVITKNNIKAE